MNGEYGIGNCGYPVMAENYETALLYKKALLSAGSKEILKSTQLSNLEISLNFLRLLTADFYKHFV